MINSITASFPDKDDFSSTNQIAESGEAEEDNDVGADDMCMDLDPRCDDYKTFCDAANIQVLCPVTCQIGACKTTTTSTTKTTTTHTTTTKSTTTTTPNGTYAEYEGSAGSGDGYYIEGSGVEGSGFDEKVTCGLEPNFEHDPISIRVFLEEITTRVCDAKARSPF